MLQNQEKWPPQVENEEMVEMIAGQNEEEPQTQDVMQRETEEETKHLKFPVSNAHKFICKLSEKKKLLRNYSQNIDARVLTSKFVLQRTFDFTFRFSFENLSEKVCVLRTAFPLKRRSAAGYLPLGTPSPWR